MKRRYLLASAAISPLSTGQLAIAATEGETEKLPDCVEIREMAGWDFSIIIKSESLPVSHSAAMSRYADVQELSFKHLEMQSARRGEIRFSTTSKPRRLSITLPKVDIVKSAAELVEYEWGENRVLVMLDGRKLGQLQISDGYGTIETDDDVYQAIKSSNKMTFKIDNDAVSAEFVFDTSAMSRVEAELDLFIIEQTAAVRAFHERHPQAFVEADSVCRSPGCVMTTAAVHMLGRGDDCFELTKMRALRARFADEQAVIDDYVASSYAILNLGMTPAMRFGLMVFYTMIVLPTAVAVQLNRYHFGRRLYLIGFNLLKISLLGSLSGGSGDSRHTGEPGKSDHRPAAQTLDLAAEPGQFSATKAGQ